MKALKINREEMNEQSVDQEVTLYAAKIGGISELAKAMISGAISAPPSLQIHCELLACLLLMARILSLPTVLIAAGGQRSNRKSSNPELEVHENAPILSYFHLFQIPPIFQFQALYELGQLVASNLGLCFSKDKIQQKHSTKSTSVREPWRALYG
ncbi:hypothetical protein BHE74_00055077 [Ensete ventricosum]|nr:hypothetical protein GW17_00004500 [Ensete ventricosum]RWW39578.1 hypothetical protein BHE74_00055077 [Ensete ventricosum]RZS28122.1 hypothetical protein BHM03_00061684 [Ensete ventricosum]